MVIADLRADRRSNNFFENRTLRKFEKYRDTKENFINSIYSLERINQAFLIIN